MFEIVHNKNKKFFNKLKTKTFKNIENDVLCILMFQNKFILASSYLKKHTHTEASEEWLV